MTQICQKNLDHWGVYTITEKSVNPVDASLILVFQINQILCLVILLKTGFGVCSKA